jgi:hypothetical protein
MTFQGLGSREVVADFDGGRVSSDAGVLLLRETERRCRILQDFARCFLDGRQQVLVEHELSTMLAQRVYGICLGYEDLNDHDELRGDVALAVACEHLDPMGERRWAERDRGKALAGKSTLCRLEAGQPYRGGRQYCRISWDDAMLERLLVEKFLQSYRRAPKEIVLDVDETDDPLHGQQQGRHFHAYYDEYCYLPLYIYCGSQVLCAKLRSSNLPTADGVKEELARVVERIRQAWPGVRIIVRGDSGFGREDIMSWAESEGIGYVFGLARNSRLEKRIETEMARAQRRYRQSGQAARFYKDFLYRTRDSWTRARRVVGKAEFLSKGANPRFIVTNLSKQDLEAQQLYEKLYCARGNMENRIKEQYLDLFADRTPCFLMRANQLRLYFAVVAYMLMDALRRLGLRGTKFARAQAHTIRMKLLKIGAIVKVSVRRVVFSLAGGYPYQAVFRRVLAALTS